MLLYLLLKAVATVVSWIPLLAATFLFRIIFRSIYALSPKLRSRIESNYRKISPEWDRLRISQTARSSFENYGIFSLEFLLNSTARGRKKFKLNISPQTWETVKQLNALDSGVLIATTHFGNWEIGGEFLKQYFPGRTIAVVADGLSGGYGKFIRSTREDNGFVVLDSLKDVRKIYHALDEKQVVAILFDRPVNIGASMPIGKAQMNIPEGLIRIAQKSKSALVFGYALKNQNQVFEGLFNPEFLTAAQVQSLTSTLVVEWLARCWNKTYQTHPNQWYMFRNIN